jgi:co-chaperonin GroES (HSP10)
MPSIIVHDQAEEGKSEGGIFTSRKTSLFNQAHHGKVFKIARQYRNDLNYLQNN